MRIGCPELLPTDEKHQLRLEDLLGFRRNPLTSTPLFLKYRVKPLDGHPTPATPFLRLSTGASGVGVTASLGLALGAMDYYGSAAPRVHIVEGEGGMTPGRVGEAMAAAGTACLKNAILHVDWNQASIDSNQVCRDGESPGEYVQWNPIEFALLHDWNAILVPDGMDFEQIAAAQRRALSLPNDQPTAIVYRTRKGWQYGVAGKASHGAGHGLCADGFFQALTPFVEQAAAVLPRCASANQRCHAGRESAILEECFWEALTVIRSVLGKKPPDGGGAGAETAPGATAPGQPDPQTSAARPCGSGRVRSGGDNRGPHPGRVDVDPRKGGNPERRIGPGPSAITTTRARARF